MFLLSFVHHHRKFPGLEPGSLALCDRCRLHQDQKDFEENLKQSLRAFSVQPDCLIIGKIAVLSENPFKQFVAIHGRHFGVVLKLLY